MHQRPLASDRMLHQPSTSSTCHCRFTIVPRHHSALQSQGLFWRRFLAACRVNSRAASEPTSQNRLYISVLILQCHSEAVFWKGLVPLLMTAHSQLESSPTNSPTKSVTSERARETTLASNGDRNISRPTASDNYAHNHESSCAATRRRNREEDTASITSSLAFSILVNHFQNQIQHITTIPDNDEDDDRLPLEIACQYDEDDDAAINNHATTFFHWSSQCNYHSKHSCGNNYIPTILLLLPPNPYYWQQQQHNLQCYSRAPSSSPRSSFALTLIHHENTLIRLTSLSAYISTLGGGFFLCRYLSTAIILARRQCCIAMMRGDRDMALKCRINIGYCYIHNGKLNRGKKVIRRVLKDVMHLQRSERGGAEGGEKQLLLNHTAERELSELTIIRNMCLSALRFANQIREAGLRCSSIDGGEAGGSSLQQHTFGGMQESLSTTHDDFQRIRIVGDRRWGMVMM